MYYNKPTLVNVMHHFNLVTDQRGQSQNQKSQHHLKSTYLFVIFTFCHQNIQNIKEFSLLSQCSPKGCFTLDLEKLTNFMNLMYHSFQSDKGSLFEQKFCLINCKAYEQISNDNISKNYLFPKLVFDRWGSGAFLCW